MVYLLKMVIFNSHVKLPECTLEIKKIESWKFASGEVEGHPINILEQLFKCH